MSLSFFAKLEAVAGYDEITTLVGAVLNKQRCWDRTACFVGARSNVFVAKEVVFA